MPNIKFAIFDVGQTIYPFTLSPLNDLMQKQTKDKNIFKNHHTAFDYDYNPYMKGFLTHNEFALNLCQFCNVDYHDNIPAQINLALHQGQGKPFEKTLKAMQIFQSFGIEIGILSNALPALSDSKIPFAKPQYIFTSYELGLLKPDIKIYQALAEHLHTPYEQILFIDDKERNITAAHSLGIHGIVYNQATILQEITAYLPEKPLR